MKILITGSFGYIGGRLGEYLFTEGNYNLRLVGRKAKHWPFEWCRASEFCEIDLTNENVALDALCDGVDAIVHLAALNERACIQHQDLAIKVNILGTQKLLESAVRTGVKRFIYLSTAHVYGSPLQGVLNESSIPRPVHPYAITHRAAEDYVLALHEEKLIEGVVLRLSNSFGPPAHYTVPCWGLLLNDLACQSVLKNKIVIKSSGLQYRDFVPMLHVCETIRQFLTFSTHELGDGLFNLGGDCSVPVINMVKVLGQCFKSLTGKELEVETGIFPMESTVNSLEYSTVRLKKLGIQCETTIDSELVRLFYFLENHKDMLKA